MSLVPTSSSLSIFSSLTEVKKFHESLIHKSHSEVVEDQKRKADDVKREQAARAAEFIRKATQGNTALERITTGVVTLKTATINGEAGAAKLYGSVLNLQRAAVAISLIIGAPYSATLRSPDNADFEEILDLKRIQTSVDETVSLLVRVINIMKLLHMNQETAKEHLSTLETVTQFSGLSQADLTTLAAGSASESFFEDLKTAVQSFQPVETAGDTGAQDTNAEALPEADGTNQQVPS